ncbi:MAG: glycine cleavage system aminomethyltransferase GcvT [Phycisphaerae bacterium]
MAEKTYLYNQHEAAGGKMVDFGGWLLPVQFEGIIAEHDHCRSRVSIFDTCHMGQFLVRGPKAAKWLSWVCTQNAEKLGVGKCRYGFFLNESGGVRDDAIMCRLAEDEFLLTVNSDPTHRDMHWLEAHRWDDGVELVDQSLIWGKFDVQGPESFDVLANLTDFDLAEPKFYNARRGKVCGTDGIVARTGYTGELGYEVYLPGRDLPEAFEALLSNESVKPAGLGARDLLRLELCYPLYGQDVTEENNPLEADSDRFISFDREFIGSEALQKVAEQGPVRRLMALKSDTRQRPKHGQEIHHGSESVGVITSGAFSPSLGVSVALGYVRSDLCEVGTELTVKTGRRRDLTMTVAEKPLFREGTCRKKLPLQESKT